MNKHTPGPWVARGAYIGAGACDLVMMTRPDPNDSEVIAEWGANARLIAAAPELLYSLGQLLEKIQWPPDSDCRCHISPPCNDCVDYAGLRSAIADAEAAIAKTKGANHE